MVKKKVTLSDDDNIITDDPDATLELGKSISLTDAEEAEAVRKVHATHSRIVTESIHEYAKKKSSGRSSRGVTIQDTPSKPKPKPATSKPKLKGAQSLTPAKKGCRHMQALEESKKTSKRQPGTRGSSEGTGTIPGVPDESTVVSATSSEGTGTKPGVLDEENDITGENVILEWGSEQESEYSEEDKVDDEEKDDYISDNQDADDETEFDEDDIYNYKIRADAEKTEEAKDDSKKAELPPTSSILSISSGFGDQFLKFSSDTSLVVQLRVAKLEKDVSKLKKIDLSAEALAALKIQVPSVVDNYLGSKVGDVFQKELKKHTSYLIQKYSLQQIPELPKKQTPIIDLEQE
ncbi:hypothetical protein Tco_1535240, partial [Tanacetum coccineum]